MAQFISFDDGLRYFNADLVERFEDKEIDGSRATFFHMKDGSVYVTSRPISEVAEMLKAVNVWY